MSTTLHQTQGGPAAQTLPFLTCTQDEDLPDELLEHRWTARSNASKASSRRTPGDISSRWCVYE
jgi:hypothetical protein